MSSKPEPGHGSASLKIAIYVAIPTASEHHGLGACSLKARVARCLDIGDAFLHRSPKIHFHAWEVQDSNKGDILIREAVKEQLARTFAPRHVEFVEIHWGQLDDETAAQISADCDLFVIGGSGYIFTNEGRLPQRFVNDAKAIAKISCPKIAFGIGLNTLKGKEGPLDANSLAALKLGIGSLDLVSVRDEQTAELVGRVRGRAPTVTGDPVLFYRGPAPFPPSRQSSQPLRIGVNIALHGPTSAMNATRDITALAALLKHIARQHSVEFQYVAHAPSERVAWWMLRAQGVNTKWHDPHAVELPDLYRSLDAHICQMMHSAILAMSVDVPVTAFAYDRKTEGLFDLMRLPGYCIPIRGWTPDSVRPVVERMITKRTELGASIAGARMRIVREMASFVGELRGLVENNEHSVLRDASLA